MSTITTPPPEAPPHPPAAAGDPPPAGGSRSPRRALVELALVAAAVTLLAIATGWVDLLVVIACLVVMIMLHELGHLLAAKRGGMKVTEYFLGFGPRLWSFRRGETEYGIKAFPVGGYVKIPGMTNLEEVDPADEPRTYRQQSFPKRLLVAVAGSAMHFVMAFVLLFVLLAFVGVPNGHAVSIQGVSQVGGKPGPAQAAGLQPGDVVRSIDGQPVNGNLDRLTNVIRAHVGQRVPLVVDRGGRTLTLVVVPANGRTAHEAGVDAPSGTAPFGVIGVSLGSPLETRGTLRAVGNSTTSLGRLSWASIVGVGHLFSPNGVASRFNQVTSARAANQAAQNGTRVESIYGAARTAVQAAHAGVGDLLLILISINVFVGIFNLFPMLPLDGGHVAIAVYERVRSGRRSVGYHADVTKLLPFTWLMVAFLGVLFATSLLNDLVHPLANPFG